MLYEKVIDYSQDVFRNVRTVEPSQHLFDDLSDDQANWDAANKLDVVTHPPLNDPRTRLIERPFDYGKNTFIGFPFEKITVSRFSDGSFGCWYGSESLTTTVAETKYHFEQEIFDAWEAFQNQTLITVDRYVTKITCTGLAIDLSNKSEGFPWLVDQNNYTKCQALGSYLFTEGTDLLRAPSARELGGINMVAFDPRVLSNPRLFCKGQYIFNIATRETTVHWDGYIIKP